MKVVLEHDGVVWVELLGDVELDLVHVDLAALARDDHGRHELRARIPARPRLVVVLPVHQLRPVPLHSEQEYAEVA